MSQSARPPSVSEEQLLYAKILAAGMYAGLAILLATFAVYMLGIVDPAVPIEDLPNYWTLPVHEYLEAINHDYLQRDHSLTGWWWLTAVGHSDYLNFVGITILAAVTIVCYVGIIPTLLKNRDRAYAVMAAVEVVVLTLAASGVLAVGH
ncbi:MAG TPA: hypothetical protein VGA70_14245 [Longimicrobiales bacterium]|jgi:hypothetical protein